ncbi:MAG: magnesium transporter [Pseudomonadota bacterium]
MVDQVPASASDEMIEDPTPVTEDLLKSLETAVEGGETGQIKTLMEPLHVADVADVLENLRRDERVAVVTALGNDLDFDALSELDESVRDQLASDLPNATLAVAVQDMDSDDAVYLLESLDNAERSDVLSKIPESERTQIERALDYDEDTAGRLMQTEFIAVPPFWNVGRTIDYMREDDRLPETFSEIYVVDPTFHLLGRIRLDRLLRTRRPIKVDAIMDPEVRALDVHLDQEEVGRQFERYDLYAAPVTDENDRLVGVITVDDVIEVVQAEADEDVRRLGGVGDESLADTVLRVTQQRFVWLLINLATAVLASVVIGMFDATIEQMVALAVLMPIVASMGGNAATQTMTVAVRALATKDLGSVNARRIIARETIVGLLNGVMFALILGVAAWLWFGSSGLGAVIGIAMVVNMLVAGLAGILVPMALQACKAGHQHVHDHSNADHRTEPA